MKYPVVSVLAAISMTLGACSHMTETASRTAVPVASLTADEIQTELSDISRELARSRDKVRQDRANTGRRLFMSKVLEGTGASAYGLSSVAQPESPPNRRRIEALAQRRTELTVQLAKQQPQG